MKNAEKSKLLEDLQEYFERLQKEISEEDNVTGIVINANIISRNDFKNSRNNFLSCFIGSLDPFDLIQAYKDMNKIYLQAYRQIVKDNEEFFQAVIASIASLQKAAEARNNLHTIADLEILWQKLLSIKNAKSMAEIVFIYDACQLMLQKIQERDPMQAADEALSWN